MNTVSGPALKDLVDTALKFDAISTDDLAQLGIDRDSLLDPTIRIDEDILIALWRQIDQAENTQDIGLRIGQTINPSAKGLLASWVSQADSLGEALSIFRSNISLMNPAEDWSLRQDGSLCRLTFRFTSDGYTNSAIERSMSALVSWARALGDQAFQIKAAEFSFNEPAYADKYSPIFGKNILFSAQENALVFNSDLLDAPIKTGNRFLKTVIQDQAEKQLKLIKSQKSMTQKTIELIDHSLQRSHAPTIAEICQTLAISRQTLYRKLSEENADYSQLLDERRKALAHTYLVSQQLTPQQTGLNLGFKETSSFYKAFKRWFQTTPAQYQSNKLEG